MKKGVKIFTHGYVARSVAVATEGSHKYHRLSRISLTLIMINSQKIM